MSATLKKRRVFGFTLVKLNWSRMKRLVNHEKNARLFVNTPVSISLFGLKRHQSYKKKRSVIYFLAYWLMHERFEFKINQTKAESGKSWTEYRGQTFLIAPMDNSVELWNNFLAFESLFLQCTYFLTGFDRSWVWRPTTWWKCCLKLSKTVQWALCLVFLDDLLHSSYPGVQGTPFVLHS